MNRDVNHDRGDRVRTASDTGLEVTVSVPVGDTVHRSPDTAEKGTVSGHGQRGPSTNRNPPKREPHYTDDAVTLWHGDCLDVLAELPDASVDAVVTDPPYALNFMGRKWDRFETAPGELPPVCEMCGNDHATEGYRLCTDCLAEADDEDLRDAPMLGQRAANWHDKGGHTRGYHDNNNAAFERWCALWAAECLRVLKPGGHLLAFGGSRTWHRLAAAVEDVGFDIRDSIAWLYGSGFPKSLDVAKAIDKSAGHWRGRAGEVESSNGSMSGGNYTRTDKGAPVTPEAERWSGWGTALKPAFEPIVVGRKPLAGTVAGNVLAHGTGALNIDATRVPMNNEDREKFARGSEAWAAMSERRGQKLADGTTRKATEVYGDYGNTPSQPHDAGRWPANVVLDDTQAAELDRQSGVGTSRRAVLTSKPGGIYGGGNGLPAHTGEYGYDDTGGASRFFPTFRYEAKAATAERSRVGDVTHPTVKPLGLMRWLVRLVTPPGGTVLDPFAGSGTTAEACVIEGFRCVTIEREADYLPLIVARLSKPIQLGLDLGGAP